MRDAGGAEFRWIESGDGEPVLLLHGLLGDLYHWEASVEALAPACRPIALALPIFDRRLADALGIVRAVIGGNSLGGHVALTTPAGLWSYLLGDTVRFVAREPLRLEITGRTRHFVNAFGENVIVEEVERALVAACRCAHAEVVEFTVAPRYPSVEEPRGGHDWLVEFAEPPRCPLEIFTAALDEALMGQNADYRAKRTAGVGMVAPRLVELPAGTFHRWMRGRGRLGDQHKVPRVTNSRAVADALLATVAGRASDLPRALAAR